jgi:multisubunit Na+/H+ antiporter MnhB subunit
VDGSAPLDLDLGPGVGHGPGPGVGPGVGPGPGPGPGPGVGLYSRGVVHVVGLVIVGALALVAVITLARPDWVRRTFFWTHELPSDIDGRPYLWPIRAVTAIVLAALAVIAIGVAWPDDETRGLAVGWTTVVLGVGLTIGFVAAMAARHDRQSRILRDIRGYNDHERRHGAELVDEPVAPSFAFEILLVGVLVVVVLLAAVATASQMGVGGPSGG